MDGVVGVDWVDGEKKLIGHRQKQNLDPLLIVVTSKQGLPKLARLAQIYPPPSFSHHQAITTTIRIGSKFCFC